MSFDSFWEIFPKKVKKVRAQKIWNKLKLDPLTPEIIEALNKQKKHWKDIQFVPHPSSWLNDQRWNDEVIEDGESVSGQMETDWNRILEHIRKHGSMVKITTLSSRGLDILRSIGGLSTIGQADSYQIKTLRNEFKNRYLEI